MSWEITENNEVVDVDQGLKIEYKHGDDAWDEFFYIVRNDGEVLEGGVSLEDLGVPAEVAIKFVKEVKIMNTQTDLEDFTGNKLSDHNPLMAEGNFFPEEEKKSALPKVGHNSGLAADRLLSLVNRIETLVDEVKGLQCDIKDIYTEAASAGFDKKVLREIVKIRAMDPDEMKSKAEQVELYKFALGMD